MKTLASSRTISIPIYRATSPLSPVTHLVVASAVIRCRRFGTEGLARRAFGRDTTSRTIAQSRTQSSHVTDTLLRTLEPAQHLHYYHYTYNIASIAPTGNVEASVSPATYVASLTSALEEGQGLGGRASFLARSVVRART